MKLNIPKVSYTIAEDEEPINIKLKLFPGATVPKRHGAYIDLCANETVTLGPGDYAVIPLGVAMKLPEGYHAQLLPRSSTFNKYSIIVVNSMGIIDNEYCGDEDEWKLAVFHPHGRAAATINKGERIAQFCIVKDMPEVIYVLKEHLDEKSRGGFGSTGS